MAALRDNPEAIANGNAGAAADIYVETAGIRDAAVTTGEGEKLEPARSSNTNATTDSAYNGFPVAYLRIDGYRSASNTYDTNSGSFTIARAGVYTLRMAWSGTNGSYNARVQLFVNGSSVYLSNSTTSTTLYYKYVATFAAGDTVYIRSVSGDGAANGGTGAATLLGLCDNPLIDIKPSVYLKTTYSTPSTASTGIAYWAAT
jgi:hypothetical protein